MVASGWQAYSLHTVSLGSSLILCLCHLLGPHCHLHLAGRKKSVGWHSHFVKALAEKPQHYVRVPLARPQVCGRPKLQGVLGNIVYLCTQEERYHGFL